MKIGALYLGFWRIAWHWKWSLTWRWIFHIKKHDRTVKMGFHKLPEECMLIVWNTRLADFAFQTQPNMHRRQTQLDLKYQRFLDKLIGYVDD